MSTMLASDLNNPEFVGARNPDDLLFVEFYWNEPVDKNKSEEQGKLIRTAKTPYIRIMRPGDNTSIIETPVRDDHKARWPRLWLAWQMKEGLIEGDADIPGWKVEDWKELNDDQRHELKYLRFHTVEMIAGASDAQAQRMGMGGMSLRDKARAALREKMASGVRDELERKEKEIAELRRRDAEKEERLAKLEAAIAGGAAMAQNAGKPAEPPKQTTLGVPRR